MAEFHYSITGIHWRGGATIVPLDKNTFKHFAKQNTGRRRDVIYIDGHAHLGNDRPGVRSYNLKIKRSAYLYRLKHDEVYITVCAF